MIGPRFRLVLQCFPHVHDVLLLRETGETETRSGDLLQQWRQADAPGCVSTHGHSVKPNCRGGDTEKLRACRQACALLMCSALSTSSGTAANPSSSSSSPELIPYSTTVEFERHIRARPPVVAAQSIWSGEFPKRIPTCWGKQETWELPVGGGVSDEDASAEHVPVKGVRVFLAELTRVFFGELMTISDLKVAPKDTLLIP